MGGRSLLLPLGLAWTILLTQTPAPNAAPSGGVVQSICTGCLPTHTGKDFGGDVYFDWQGTLYAFKEAGGRLQLHSAKASPEELTRWARLRKGEVWNRTGTYATSGELRIWGSDHAHAFRVDPPCEFSDFMPLFDGRVLLVHTWTPGVRENHRLEVADGHQGGRKALEDWPDKLRRDRGPGSFSHFYDALTELVPYEEYVLVYGPISGRLQLVDASRGQVKELDLPWTGPSDEDPDLKHLDIERRVPKCVQFVPTVDDTVIVVWDEHSLGLDSDTWAKRREAGTPREKPRFKALALRLGTGESRPVEVPEGLDMPFYSTDGVTLRPLAALAPTR